MRRWMAGLMALMMLCAACAWTAYAEERAFASLGRVAAGEKHAVVLREDGTCVAFGDNSYGQCDVGAWRDVASIAAGAYHTIAVLKDGTCVATGNNEHGQCDVSAWRDIKAAAAGESHTIALKNDGTCVAIGLPGVHKNVLITGKETFETQYNPCAVEEWKDITAISAGGNLSAGLTKDGRVLAVGEIDDDDLFGIDDTGEETILYGISTWPDARQITVGPNNTVIALLHDGTTEFRGGFTSAYWPREWGICSHCNPGIDRFIVLDPRAMPYWTDIVALYSYNSDYSDGYGACGVTFGLKKDGTVVMASEDTFGLSAATEWTDIVDLASGGGFVIGVKRDGTIVCTGKGICDMIMLPAVNNVSDVAVYYDCEGYGYVLGVNADGTLQIHTDPDDDYWGGDERLYHADEETDIATVACAPDGYIALKKDGTVSARYEAFSSLDGLEHTVKVAAGGREDHSFALALAVSGLVNAAGEIDVTWANARDIAASATGAVVAFDDGTVATAGALTAYTDGCAQWTDILAVAAGDKHVVGLKSDGTCVATGDNEHGQCNVNEWTNVKAIVCGPRHTLALFKDGTCAAVGDDNTLKRGESFFDGALNVTAWKNVVAVRATEGLSVGLTADGELLLAGLDTVDIGGIKTERLWTGERARNDAPLIPSERLTGILRTIDEAKADYQALQAFLKRRSDTAAAIKASHPEYDDVWSEYGGLLLYKQNGLYGFLNENGDVALEAKYDGIDRQPTSGMYVIWNENGYGFADETGALRVPCQYDKTNGYDAYGYARVGMGGYWEITWEAWIDRDGVIVADSEEAYKAYTATLPKPERIAPTVRYVSSASDDEHTDEFEGYIDPTTGEAVTPLLFNNAYDFEDGIAQFIICNIPGYINEDFLLLSDITVTLP